MVLIIVVLFLIGLSVYIILQRWYKVKYERYLFKDRNHLYNIFTYISNARNQGMEDREIEKNLKKVGWDSEQIRYAFRKYKGKNTGMPSLLPGKSKPTPPRNPTPRQGNFPQRPMPGRSNNFQNPNGSNFNRGNNPTRP